MKIAQFIPSVLFGVNSFDNLNEFIDELYPNKDQYSVYIIDSIHHKTGLFGRLTPTPHDVVIEFNASSHEPKTSDVDAIYEDIITQKGEPLPRIVVGIGGGSTMDVAKAVSIMVTNPGSSADYQGYDLVKNKPVPKIAVPTLSGTGAEATRTTVLTGPQRKFGINSKYSIYDAVILDPELLKTVPPEQEFFFRYGQFHSLCRSLEWQCD